MMNCENVVPVQKTTSGDLRSPIAAMPQKRLRAKRSPAKTAPDRLLENLAELENNGPEQTTLLGPKQPERQIVKPQKRTEREFEIPAPIAPNRSVSDDVENRVVKAQRRKRVRYPLADITHIILTIEALREEKKRRLKEAGETPVEPKEPEVTFIEEDDGLKKDENGVPIALGGNA
eukprot:g7039.t1